MKFIETLRLENGEIPLIELHQKRVDLTLLAHYGAALSLGLRRALDGVSKPRDGLFKIRITYSNRIESIEVEPYTRRTVTGIALVPADGIDYRYKYADRRALDRLRQNVPEGVEPIICQQGQVRDALYANVCFFDGIRWLTPEVPLLYGVARHVALLEGKVAPARITVRDIEKGIYKEVKLINAMRYFGEAPRQSL